MSPGQKRSRWGDRTNPAAETTASGVSDAEALQALVSAAHERDRKREQQQQPQHRPQKQQRRVDDRRKERERSQEDDYYGPPKEEGDDKPARHKGERSETEAKQEDSEEPVEKQKANFGLSGALTKDAKGGNVYKGVVLKFREPAEARAPNTLWRLYVYKGEEQLETLHISKQSAYLFGRNEEIADIVLQHPSSSSQHAVLQYRAVPNQQGKLHCQPYLMDLESTNGTHINGVRIEPARYYQLKKGDVLSFGASKREYVLLAANTKSI